MATGPFGFLWLRWIGGICGYSVEDTTNRPLGKAQMRLRGVFPLMSATKEPCWGWRRHHIDQAAVRAIVAGLNRWAARLQV